MKQPKKAPKKLYKELDYFNECAAFFRAAACQTQNDKDNVANYERWANQAQARINAIENPRA